MNHLVFYGRDSESRVELRRLLRRKGVVNSSSVVSSPANLKAYIDGQLPFADKTEHPNPSVIFLDISSPTGLDFEILKWLRNHRATANTFIVLSGPTSTISEIRKAYQCGATTFLLYPYDEQEVGNLIANFPQFWHINQEQAL